MNKMYINFQVKVINMYFKVLNFSLNVRYIRFINLEERILEKNK